MSQIPQKPSGIWSGAGVQTVTVPEIGDISTRSGGIIRKMWQRALEEREQLRYRLGRHETFDIEWSVKYLDRTKVLGFEYKRWEMVLVLWAVYPRCI